jgi:hypothetical protein
MDRTITLRLPNTPARRDIARGTVVALAVKTGMAPLAADRAGAAVADAVVAIAADEVTIVATLGAASTLVEVTGGGAPPVAFTLARTPLRQV